MVIPLRNFPMPDTTEFLRINELKNYLYCPRISFYTLCLDLDRITRLAELGINAERETRARMRRRKHALHAVIDGERFYSMPVWSTELGLVGQVDEIVVAEGAMHLVDYKDTDRDYGYWKAQMAAYAFCAEETYALPVDACYVYAIPTQTYEHVKITKREERKLHTALEALRTMVSDEVCPPPVKQLGKCRTCQYRRFCNDVR